MSPVCSAAAVKLLAPALLVPPTVRLSVRSVAVRTTPPLFGPLVGAVTCAAEPKSVPRIDCSWAAVVKVLLEGLAPVVTKVAVKVDPELPSWKVSVSLLLRLARPVALNVALDWVVAATPPTALATVAALVTCVVSTGIGTLPVIAL